MLAFALYSDAKARGYDIPGTEVLAVAAAFQVWSAIEILQSDDFYVDAN